MTTFVLALIIEAAFIGTIILLFRRRSRLTRRVFPFDVEPHLRRVDTEGVAILFDHEEEEKLAALWNPVTFRHTQRSRLDLAYEYVLRMYHNVRIIRQWINTDWSVMIEKHLVINPELVEMLRKTTSVTA